MLAIHTLHNPRETHINVELRECNLRACNTIILVSYAGPSSPPRNQAKPPIEATFYRSDVKLPHLFCAASGPRRMRGRKFRNLRPVCTWTSSIGLAYGSDNGRASVLSMTGGISCAGSRERSRAVRKSSRPMRETSSLQNDIVHRLCRASIGPPIGCRALVERLARQVAVAQRNRASGLGSQARRRKHLLPRWILLLRRYRDLVFWGTGSRGSPRTLEAGATLLCGCAGFAFFRTFRCPGGRN